MVLIALIALWIVVLTLCVTVIFFWVQMLADAAQRKFPESNEKLIWLLVITFTAGLGALVYYFSVKKKTA